ncbi:MAG: alkaline phosphatase family protein [Planctomycetota bacterium]|nr:alkaline phosphatase family protein [Planctomycetota bacterium]
MKPVLVVDVVGLTPRLVTRKTPNLAALTTCIPMSGVLPAVTCSAQATMLTGLLPRDHGVVGNGWFTRDIAEIALWRQSNALVTGEKVYETAKKRDSRFTCAKIFWWWNLGAAVDWSITPRPFYPADGRKIPAVYGAPDEYAARLESELGKFPFFDFWGPKSGLPSTRWIADAAIRTMLDRKPTLTLVYLPHLDYDFQRFGPDDPRSDEAVVEIDRIVGDLRAAAERIGAATIVVSEYGLTNVSRPVHVNRALREAGFLKARVTPGGDVLDVFASRAFAVADHQIAHVYVKDPRDRHEVRACLTGLAGVEQVLEGAALAAEGLDHARSGDLVAISTPDAWFTYYYWPEGGDEPDFAPTVDIHRKPGYDPCELFVDPALASPKLRVVRRLLQKKLGFRYLMDVIPRDAALVKGSHGRRPLDERDGPVFLSNMPLRATGSSAEQHLAMTSVRDRILAALERV